MPVDLGHWPHQCKGNINKCPVGFTVSFSLIPSEGDPKIRDQYLLSSGGQSLQSEGYYVRRQFGKNYQITVAKDTKLWTVDFYLQDNVEASVLFTFKEGLDVYVDGLTVGSDPTGKARDYPKPLFDQCLNLVVGAANDDRSGKTTPSLRIWNLKHWDKFYISTEVATFYGE